MISVNDGQVKKVAEVIKNIPEESRGLDFNTEMYPPLNNPDTIKFFFFVGTQNFGFWYGDKYGYVEPLIGVVDGKPAKGSDLLWKSARKAFETNLALFFPQALAKISVAEFATIFSDDNGPIPFPDIEARFQVARSYGEWFLRVGILPETIVSDANKESAPLKYFLKVTRQIPGYKNDPFLKKNILLAMMLANRKEQFLKVSDPKNWQPIVDYHLMRVALRLGLVELDFNNSGRRWTSESNEKDIRAETYHAVEKLINLSGRSMSFVDEKLWMARRYCPEMEKPQCEKCIFDSICKKRIDLFQPIFRTTAY